MDKITSFCIDHDILDKGLYITRVDRDIITYDLRIAKVYGEEYGHVLANWTVAQMTYLSR